MTFSELINKRESCRDYKGTPIEREKIMEIIEAARLSPSACNSQPWRFIVVDDKNKTKELGALLQDKIININKFVGNVPAFIVVIEENANLSSKLGGRFKDQDFAKVDIGIVAENISLAATELGLGSCIMGWFDEKALKKLLEIPSKKRIRLIISLGERKSDIIRIKIRKDINDILSFNKW